MQFSLEWSTEQDALKSGAFVAMKSYMISVGALKATLHVKFSETPLFTVIVDVDWNTHSSIFVPEGVSVV